MSRFMLKLYVFTLVVMIPSIAALYLDGPNEEALDGGQDSGRDTDVKVKRSMRQWIRVDKIRYNCLHLVNAYMCSCQYLFCNPWLRSCGSCIVTKPDKWKNAITGRDCSCDYSNYYGK